MFPSWANAKKSASARATSNPGPPPKRSLHDPGPFKTARAPNRHPTQVPNTTQQVPTRAQFPTRQRQTRITSPSDEPEEVAAPEPVQQVRTPSRPPQRTKVPASRPEDEQEEGVEGHDDDNEYQRVFDPSTEQMGLAEEPMPTYSEAFKGQRDQMSRGVGQKRKFNGSPREQSKRKSSHIPRDRATLEVDEEDDQVPQPRDAPHPVDDGIDYDYESDHHHIFKRASPKLKFQSKRTKNAPSASPVQRQRGAVLNDYQDTKPSAFPFHVQTSPEDNQHQPDDIEEEADSGSNAGLERPLTELDTFEGGPRKATPAIDVSQDTDWLVRLVRTNAATTTDVVTALRNERDQHAQEIAEKDKEITSAQQLAQEARAEVDRISHQISELQSHLNRERLEQAERHQDELKASTVQINYLKEQIHKSEAQRDLLQQKLDAQQEIAMQLREAMSASQERKMEAAQIEERWEKVRAHNETLKTMLEEVEGRLKEANERCNSLEAELRRRNGDLEERLKSIDGSLLKIGEGMKSTRHFDADHFMEIMETRSKRLEENRSLTHDGILESRQMRVEGMLETLQSSDVDVDEIRKLIEELETVHLSRLSEEKEAHLGDIAVGEERLQTAIADQEKLREELRNCRSEREQLKIQIESLKFKTSSSSNMNVSPSLEEAQARIKEMEAQANESQARRSELEAQVKELESRGEDAVRAMIAPILGEKNEEIDGLKQRIEALQLDIRDRAAEIKSLKNPQAMIVRYEKGEMTEAERVLVTKVKKNHESAWMADEVEIRNRAKRFENKFNQELARATDYQKKLDEALAREAVNKKKLDEAQTLPNDDPALKAAQDRASRLLEELKNRDERYENLRKDNVTAMREKNEVSQQKEELIKEIQELKKEACQRGKSRINVQQPEDVALPPQTSRKTSKRIQTQGPKTRRSQTIDSITSFTSGLNATQHEGFDELTDEDDVVMVPGSQAPPSQSAKGPKKTRFSDTPHKDDLGLNIDPALGSQEYDKTPMPAPSQAKKRSTKKHK